MIERGIQTFVDVGLALLAVREQRLWRTYGTFENYCSERWGWTPGRVRQLTGAATTIINLQNDTMVSEGYHPLPVTESHAPPMGAAFLSQKCDLTRINPPCRPFFTHLNGLSPLFTRLNGGQRPKANTPAWWRRRVAERNHRMIALGALDLVVVVAILNPQPVERCQESRLDCVLRLNQLVL